MRLHKGCKDESLSTNGGDGVVPIAGPLAARCISESDLAILMEEMALRDPELVAHYAWLIAALPGARAQRAAEDAEIASVCNAACPHPRAA